MKQSYVVAKEGGGLGGELMRLCEYTPKDRTVRSDKLLSSLIKPLSKDYGLEQPHHDFVEELAKRDVDGMISSETPFWSRFRVGDSVYRFGGVSDILIIRDGVLYICDYKPDLRFDRNGEEPQKSFLTAVPQVSSYALLAAKQLGIPLSKIKCITFNKQGYIEYDPVKGLEFIQDLFDGEGVPSTFYINMLIQWGRNSYR